MFKNSISLIEKIFSNFKSLNHLSKSLIKYGLMFYLLLQIIGALILLISILNGTFDFNTWTLSTSIIKVSFTILAEIIIGGILIDYIFNNKS